MVESLVIEYLSHLSINSCELRIIAVSAGRIRTLGGFLIALKGHGGLAGLIVGAAEEIVGQQAVVGSALVVEELDVGLHVLHREGLVVAVALVDAVQPAPHAVAVGLGGAAAQCHQQYEYAQQLFHSAKIRISEDNTKQLSVFYPRIIAAPYQGALNVFIAERKYLRSLFSLLQNLIIQK